MTKHEYICAIADVVRSKSDCFKRKVGAVFVNADYEILATGYNAPPRGFQHCDRTDERNNFVNCMPHTCGEPCTRTIHAEQNAVAQAAKRGTALAHSTLYCTYAPCQTCARLLINIGVVKVVVLEKDKDVTGHEELAMGGIPVFYAQDHGSELSL